MTTGQRIQMREVLRQARDQSMLVLSAANVVTETETLLAIGGALELLHDKPELYGVCQECGWSIPLEWLRFFPWISRCEEHARLPIQ